MNKRQYPKSSTLTNRGIRNTNKVLNNAASTVPALMVAMSFARAEDREPGAPAACRATVAVESICSISKLKSFSRAFRRYFAGSAACATPSQIRMSAILLTYYILLSYHIVLTYHLPSYPYSLD
jgi:hypothetical protein